MWIIYEKKSIIKTIKKIPRPILKHYELWKRIIELEGPAGLRKIKGLHDEALTGQFKGFRSSRLSFQWRLVYKIKNKELYIYVIDINPHKYK